MAVRRTKQNQPGTAFGRLVQPNEITYRFKADTTITGSAKSSAPSVNSRAFTQVFPYEVSLLYGDLIKTATLALLMIIGLVVVWRMGVIR